MNQNPDFINPESAYTPDNSPTMQLNNLHLELRNLPPGEIDVDKKRILHAQIVELAKATFTEEKLERALAIAHQDLEESLKPTADPAAKYTV